MEVEPLNPPFSRHFSLPDLVTFFCVITGGQGREADAKPVGSREKSIHPQMTGPLGAKKISRGLRRHVENPPRNRGSVRTQGTQKWEPVEIRGTRVAQEKM